MLPCSGLESLDLLSQGRGSRDHWSQCPGLTSPVSATVDLTGLCVVGDTGTAAALGVERREEGTAHDLNIACSGQCTLMRWDDFFFSFGACSGNWLM